MKRGSATLEKKRDVTVIEDSDSDSWVPLRAPKSPLTFRQIPKPCPIPKSPKSPFRPISKPLLKRPAPDSTTTTKGEKGGRVSSANKFVGSTITKKDPRPRPLYNRLPLVSPKAVQQEKDRNIQIQGQMLKNVAGSSSAFRQTSFSSAAAASVKRASVDNNFMPQRRHQIEQPGMEMEDQEDTDISFLMSEYGVLITRRLNAKKARIEKAFQIPQAPDTLFEVEKANADARMEKYRKYSSAISKLKLHTDAIMKKHEDHRVTMHRMVESILKGVTRITLDLKTVKEETANCYNNIIKTRESFVQMMCESGKTAVERYREGLENWEQECLDALDNQARDSLESVVKYI